MRHSTDRPEQVGLFLLDGTEKVSEVAKAVADRRAEVDRFMEAQHEERRAAFERGELPKGTFAHPTFFPAMWPAMPKYPSHKPGYRKPRPIKVAPGDGVVRHDADTERALARCSAALVEFWALAPRGEVWGVRDGEYVIVSRHGDVRKYEPE